MDEMRWAGAYYRVERESLGVMMRKRQRRKATELALEHGDPLPGKPQDVVRIFDRTGEVVFEREWGADRVQAAAHESKIIDDLLHLDVLTFRAKYGISNPDDENGPAGPAPGPGQDGGDRTLGAS